MESVLPDFFGISQCLIVVRVAFSKEFGSSRGTTGPSSRTISFAHPSHLFSGSDKYRTDYVEAAPEEHTLEPLPRAQMDSPDGDASA